MFRCTAVFAVLLSLLPVTSRAEPPASEGERVRQLVREAGQLMDRGDKAGAVAKLLQAQQLRPDPSLDYNLGVAYADWERPAEAAAAFERFLRGAREGAVTADRIADAKQHLAAYQRRLGRLSVQLLPGSPAPATVFVDNRLLGPAPLAGAWLAPGSHEVRVASPGTRDYIVTVALQPGEERSVTAQLVSLSGALPLVPPEGPPPPPPLYRRWWFWTAVGSGAVVVAALVGAGASGRFDRRAPGSDLDPLDVAR